jgi:hypothetical protein
LQVGAQRGIASAIERLSGGPECPEHLAYLLDWTGQLHGRSGMTDHGPAPLSWPTVAAWSQFSGLVPEPCECDALFTLDGVLLFPGEMKAAE